jgi:hypothetical protein
MTEDEIANGDLDAEPPPPRLWWTLHRPETYSLAAFMLAALSVLNIGAGNTIASAVEVSSNNPRLAFGVEAGIRLAVAVVAFGLGWLAVRFEDDDVTWSAPVARAALVVGGLSVLLNLASVVVDLSQHPGGPQFGG